jgi:hypothetical protein
MTRGFTGRILDSKAAYQTPVTGFSFTIDDNCWHLIIDPAGTLATGTITMCPNPFDGQLVKIVFSQAITALTVAANTGQSILGNPTTIAAGGIIDAIYMIGNTTWYL